MKVAFYLTESRNFRDGVTHYAFEIIKRLPKESALNFCGDAFIGLEDDAKEVKSYYEKASNGLKLNIVKKVFPYGIMRRLCYFKLPFSYERMMHNNADVRVFFHNFIPNCKMNSKKIVVVHDLTPLYDKELSIRKKKKIHKMYERTVNTADLIFTDSNFTKSEIIKHFNIPREKIRLNYCGIDYERFSVAMSAEEIETVKAKYKLSKDYILFVGQARANKNLVRLVEAYSILPQIIKNNYKLVLANHDEALLQYVKKLDLLENISLLNGIADEDLVAIYKGASLVTFVSTSEGFGIPLVESMAAGVPTVTSNVSCLPEIANDAAMLVNPYSVESIAEGITRVLSDNELRVELIQKGREQAKRFSWDECARNFYEGINYLINQ